MNLRVSTLLFTKVVLIGAVIGASGCVGRTDLLVGGDQTAGAVGESGGRAGTTGGTSTGGTDTTGGTSTGGVGMTSGGTVGAGGGEGRVVCLANQHVQANACVACGAGTTNAAGDDASGANTLAVGATGEDSAAVGINGDQSSNAARESGVVYVRRIGP